MLVALLARGEALFGRGKGGGGSGGAVVSGKSAKSSSLSSAAAAAKIDPESLQAAASQVSIKRGTILEVLCETLRDRPSLPCSLGHPGST